MKKILIKNAKAIVTCDDDRRQLFGYDILIEDSNIKEIKRNISVDDETEIIDASNYLVYPGLINTHHHFFY